MQKLQSVKRIGSSLNREARDFHTLREISLKSNPEWSQLVRVATHIVMKFPQMSRRFCSASRENKNGPALLTRGGSALSILSEVEYSGERKNGGSTALTTRPNLSSWRFGLIGTRWAEEARSVRLLTS